MTNLSEGGMAVRAAIPLKHTSTIDFAFDLSVGASVTGKVKWHGQTRKESLESSCRVSAERAVSISKRG